MQQALILAGGKGTRLASRLAGAPKPLVPIDGVPLLERQLRMLGEQGVRHVLLMANHRIDALEAFCAGFQAPGMRVDIVADSKGARGTAGAVHDALDRLEATFLVLYGDTLLDVDLGRFRDAHEKAHAAFGALGTLFLHPNDHPHDSDLVDVDRSGRISAFHAKPHAPGAFHRNLVNAALYVLDRRLIEQVPAVDGLVDFGKDVFPRALALGIPLAGYATYEYIKDIGTPDRLDRAENDLRSGKVARSRLDHAQKAVFLDRDGTLNRPAGHISTPEALVLFEGAGEAVARLNRAEYRCVMVTNQPVLARGDCDEATLGRIHAKLDTMLGAAGGFLDASYVCPHHPDKGFDGEVAALKITCECRKPAPGLIRQAQAELGIDLARSWMIGDSAADVGAARAAGVRSILVRSGGCVATMLPVEPDFEVADISDAAEFILSRHAKLADMIAPWAATLATGSLVRIAGQSRQGKSLCAGVLSELLAARGVAACHLRLDRWLFGIGQRPTGAGAREALDWADLERTIAPWLAGGALEARLPCYDPHSPDRKTSGPLAELASEGILILDGTLAMTAAVPTARPVLNVFVGGDEQARAERFRAEYERRGRGPDEIRALYRQRLAEEFPLVEAQRHQADIVLEFPFT